MANVYICKKCGNCIMTGKTIFCGKCGSYACADSRCSLEIWETLTPMDKEYIIDYVKSGQTYNRKMAKIISPPKGNKEELHAAEIQKHNRGCLFTFVGIGVVLLACLMIGSPAAAIFGMIGIGLFLWGFFPAINNRSASKIKDDEAKAKAVVSSWGAKAKAGQSLTDKDIDKAISILGMDGVQKHEERKKIIAGAVVGGIVAGDVGAVAGAVATKAKIEEEKLNK